MAVLTSDPHCSFCGKARDDVRRLIAGGGQVALDCTLAPVFVCDECVAVCAEVCAEGKADLETDLHRAIELLVGSVIELMHSPPPGYGDTPEELKSLAIQLLSPVREALSAFDTERAKGTPQTNDEALRAAHRRAWDLLDEYRRMRARRRARASNRPDARSA